MKYIYLIRHAEKDDAGLLTSRGLVASKKLGNALPIFSSVYSSGSNRAMLTAKLISRTEPTVDERANFYMAAADKSDAINKISVSMQIPFLAAVNEYNDEEVMVGVNKQASALNTLVDDLMATAPEDSSMLVVSYDLSISPAMAQRGIPLTSIDFLSGYVIKDDGSIAPFSPEVD